MVIFLTYRMYKSEDGGFANPVDHNCSAIAGLHSKFSETVLFLSLVRLASLPHSEQDLIKCSRSDLGKLYLLGLVT